MEQIVKIWQSILLERERQERKFPDKNHMLIEWVAILGEEIGEANKEIVDAHFGYKPKRGALESFRMELIQCGAVALNMIQSESRSQDPELDPLKYNNLIDSMHEEVIEGVEIFCEDKDTLGLVKAMNVLAMAQGELAQSAMSSHAYEYMSAATACIVICVAAALSTDNFLAEMIVEPSNTTTNEA